MVFKINHTKNDYMKLIIIILAFFLYTILERILYKGNWLSENRRLWSSPFTFIWGSVLLILLNFVIPGEYKPWGDILYIKEAFKHIIPWILGLLAYYSLNSQNLFKSAAALSWDSKEFYYFCFITPIFEEILFRGIILMNLLNKFPIIKYEEPFVIISSILFALFHINYEYNFKLSKDYIFGFFMIVIIGNAIGFLVLLTRSLWMSILMHILINLTGSVYFNILRLKFRNKN
ncbi:CPBP family intramembrane metalloprotease [Soehngenia longivitae]|uniref:CPBP family intramembrane metalloprotease n=1 Tax=Soehngenia longivitae TaxID=2562294 RepID=A0A4Z0D508_9FIRM|nr:CPBP family intramembrane glutamic endopeptidase [Soehngenia longivitae]TFZ40186.1 CPBP family intramembrane metalloprotease [Soehngenia longivitae]